MSFTASFVTIYLGNVKDPQLTTQLVNFTILVTKEGMETCSAEFNNWGNKGSTIDFLFFDYPLLNHGETFQIETCSLKLFSGLIEGSCARFPSGSPPLFGLTAVKRGNQPVKAITFNQPAPVYSLGNNLREFTVTEEWVVKNPTSKLMCFYRGQGTMETISEFKPGMQIDLEQIGRKYSGVYVLTEIKYMYDINWGLRTSFSAERLGA